MNRMENRFASKKVALSEVCVINPSISEMKDINDDLEVSFIPMSNVSEHGIIDLSEKRLFKDVKKGFTYFKNGDVLFAKITPCMENGKGAIAKQLKNGIGFGSTEFHVLRPTNQLDNRWLYYLTTSEEFRKTAESNMTGSAGQKRVPKQFFDKYKILLLPLNYQERAANVLDKAQELIDKRKAQIEALDELVKSRFIEMFGDPITNSKDWKIGKMNDVAPTVNYKGNFNSEKMWLLNLDMVESNTGKIIDYNYVVKEEIGNSTCTFDTTNVLYSKLRPYLNKVVIPKEMGYATSEMVPLQPVKGILNRYYLTCMLRNQSFVDYISEKVAGAKMPRVSMNDFRNFEVPLPPIDLQNQFAAFVNQTDKLKSTMEQSLKELENNFNSIMQKAFKGELFN